MLKILSLILTFFTLQILAFASQDMFYRLDSDFRGACFFGESSLIVVGSNGMAIVSLDNGETWSGNPTNTSNSLLSAAYQQNTNCLFAVGRSGTVIKSSNLGEKWEIVDIGADTTLNTIIFYKNIGIVAGDNGNLFKTTDNGITWFKINLNTKSKLVSSEVLNNGRIIISDLYAGVYISDDGFETWEFNDYSSLINNSVINKVRSSCETVIINSLRGFLKSNDNGANWEFFNFNERVVQDFIIFDDSRIVALCNPVPGDIANLVNLYEIYFTDSIKCNFYNYNHDFSKASYFSSALGLAINSFSESRKAVIYGQHNSIVLSEFPYNQWYMKSYLDISGFNPIFFLNSKTGFLGSKRQKVFRTTNGGITWLPQMEDDFLGFDVTHLHFNDTINGISCTSSSYSNAFNRTTKDGGRSYKNIEDNSIKGGNYSYFNSDIFVSLKYKTTIREIFSSISFNNLLNNKNNQIYLDSFFLNNAKALSESSWILAGSRYEQYDFDTLNMRIIKRTYPVVLLTQDFGATYEIIKSDFDFTYPLNFHSFLDGKLIIMSTLKESDEGNIYRSYKSTDRGYSWELVFESMDIKPSLIEIYEDGSGFMMGSFLQILTTNNFGDTWEIVSDDKFFKYELYRFNYVDQTLFAVGNNQLFKLKPGEKIPTSIKEVESVESGPPPFWLYPPYPNPATNRISFSLLWDKRISEDGLKIELFDVRGIKVMDITDMPKIFELDNKATVTFHPSGLSSGIYYLRVQYEGFSKAMPIFISH
ncbi:MAG: T9SS type A sorting domain-containing protein [Candidatus Kapabacteria bacterium]|nr:T9SS type A sorting domain-containing protein [Ignavibacteriota bacterium]MCW5886224.1 T9SS type A sorting domain-containing protein [Candidatus Kapabacteria bacterium]